MTPLQLAEMAVSLAEKAASGPWLRCEASDGKCQCGLVWAIPSNAVVCEATHKDSSGHCGKGFNIDTMYANGDLIAFAGTHLATLARAVIEAEAKKKAAVLAERERCARIADEMQRCEEGFHVLALQSSDFKRASDFEEGASIAKSIAAAIRAEVKP